MKLDLADLAGNFMDDFSESDPCWGQWERGEGWQFEQWKRFSIPVEKKQGQIRWILVDTDFHTIWSSATSVIAC